MKNRKSHARRKKTKILQHWLSRTGLILLILVSVILLLANSYQSKSIITVRSAVTDGAVPIIDTISSPSSWLNGFSNNFSHWTNSYEENKQLRLDKQQLLKWQIIAIKLETENKKLRKTLKLPTAPEHNYITAKIINKSTPSPHRSLIIDAGKNNGIIQNQIIIVPEGIIGRVTNIGNSSAHILAITDINSRIPVVTETSQERAILAGDGDEYPNLIYLDRKTKVKIGEKVITSSDGNLLPSGLVVGEIIEINGRKPKVQTYINWNKLDYVRIMTPNKHITKTKVVGK